MGNVGIWESLGMGNVEGREMGIIGMRARENPDDHYRLDDVQRVFTQNSDTENCCACVAFADRNGFYGCSYIREALVTLIALDRGFAEIS